MILKVANKLKSLFKNYLYHKSTILIFDFPPNKKANFQPKIDVEIKNASFENLKDILSFQAPKYVDTFKKFLEDGDNGYFAYVNGECCGRYWATQKNIVYPHFAFPYNLKESEVFIHYCETAQKMRGLGIYPYALTKIIDDFFNKTKVISVYANNISSIKGVKKVGFRERESRDYYTFGNKESKGYKVMIITQGLSPIVKPIVENYNVVGIIESAPRNYKNMNFLKKLIIKIVSILRNNNLEFFCKKVNVPYFFMTSSDENLENWVKEKKPDVIVVYSMSQLLKENIFSIPKYGTINLHPAFLPKYRGPNPLFWHYYHGETKFGITLHYIDKGEDTGDIIYQEEIQVPLGIKQKALSKILVDGIGVSLILRALENLENLPRKTQPKESSTIRAKNISKSEYKNIIDFESWYIERIWHFLRGTEDLFNLYFDDSFYFTIRKWEIDEYQKCDTSKFKIGRIYREKNKFFIACKDGKIYLRSKLSLKKLVKRLLE